MKRDPRLSPCDRRPRHGIRAASRVALAALTIAIVACRPREGRRCAGTTATCQSGREALFCRDQHYVRFACGGANGCSSEGAQVRCDQSVAHAGDTCAGDDPAHVSACSVDGRQLLHCEQHVFRVSTDCDGPSRCTVAQGQTTCDRRSARAGDPCSTPGGAACSTDGPDFLLCTDGRLVPHSHCGGPRGCYADGTRIRCDESAGAMGEACGVSHGGACSTDGMDLLRCEEGHFTLQSHCPGPRHCAHAEGTVQCDESAGNLGDACNGPGRAACSVDGRDFLRCENGVLAFSSHCPGPRGCYHDNGSVGCDGAPLGVGNACRPEGAMACAADGHQSFVCRGGRLEAGRRCGHCSVVAGRFFCL